MIFQFLRSNLYLPCRCWLESIGSFVYAQFQVAKVLLTTAPRLDAISVQLYEVGVRSLPLICATGLAIGMVLSAQSFFQLSDKGLTGITGVMVTKSMLVEIGPILASFIITGRVGAAMCAELGSMKVTEQIDAMKSMGVNPTEYLLLPRYISMAIMMPILTLFNTACGIFGGWLVATHIYGMSTQAFFDRLPYYIIWFDVISNCLKSFIFGLIIVSISCFSGMSTEGGASGVGRATTKSVVLSYSAILGANFLLTIFLNASYWYVFGFR